MKHGNNENDFKRKQLNSKEISAQNIQSGDSSIKGERKEGVNEGIKERQEEGRTEEQEWDMDALFFSSFLLSFFPVFLSFLPSLFPSFLPSFRSSFLVRRGCRCRGERGGCGGTLLIPSCQFLDPWSPNN
jgi:hypothetical protein